MNIRYFQEDEIEVLKSAVHSIWSENHVLSKETKLLTYMYRDTPAQQRLGKTNELSFLGAWEGNKIIGLLGTIPFFVNVKGKKELGHCLTNWIVLPEYRNTGAGIALLNKVQELKPSIILSLGINQQVANLYRLMKWKVQSSVPRWIGIINKEEITKRMPFIDKNSLQYWNDVRPFIKNNNNQFSNELVKEKWDEFHWSSFAPKTIGFARDYSFLKWRYIDNPFFDYKLVIYEDQNGNYLGLAVLRIEYVEDLKSSIGRIVEFISMDMDSSIQLANQLIEIGSDLLFMDFYCFSSVTSWGLESVGFRREWGESILPSRYQPLDRLATNMMASMYINSDVLKKIDIINDQTWYITKGDSDQDRPN